MVHLNWLSGLLLALSAISLSHGLSPSVRTMTRNMWPGGIVPYKISPYAGFIQWEIDNILAAMDIIMNNTCIQFVPYDDSSVHSNHLEISRQRSSHCQVEFSLRERHYKANLGTKCTGSEGLVLHELMKVLGAELEHTRPDRDEFITINWNAIPMYKRSKYYRSCNSTEVGTTARCSILMSASALDSCCIGHQSMTHLPYDIDSIMQVASGDEMSLKAQPGVSFGGQRDHLSKSDIGELNYQYPCPEATTTAAPAAEVTTMKEVPEVEITTMEQEEMRTTMQEEEEMITTASNIIAPASALSQMTPTEPSDTTVVLQRESCSDDGLCDCRLIQSPGFPNGYTRRDKPLEWSFKPGRGLGTCDTLQFASQGEIDISGVLKKDGECRKVRNYLDFFAGRRRQTKICVPSDEQYIVEVVDVTLTIKFFIKVSASSGGFRGLVCLKCR